MVSNESQRTHMSFDGLGDVLGALSAEAVAGEIEGRQRPVITDIIGDKHCISGTQRLLAEIELCFFPGQTAQGGE